MVVPHDFSFFGYGTALPRTCIEKATDIPYIKDVIGHFDIRTTERYLHLRKKGTSNIIFVNGLQRKIDW